MEPSGRRAEACRSWRRRYSTSRAHEEAPMTEPLRVAHYLNQFFAGIGGEERADVGVSMRPEPVGPGRALQAALGDAARIVGTVICGDNHVAEQEEAAVAAIRRELGPSAPRCWWRGRPSAPVATAWRARPPVGPRRPRHPAVSGMHPDNPAVEAHRSARAHRPHRGVGHGHAAGGGEPGPLRAAPGAGRDAGTGRGRGLRRPGRAPRLGSRAAGVPARARHAPRQAPRPALRQRGPVPRAGPRDPGRAHRRPRRARPSPWSRRAAS